MKTITLLLALLLMLALPSQTYAALSFGVNPARLTVTANSTINTLSAWTVIVWVRPEVLMAGRNIASKHNGISNGWIFRYSGADTTNLQVLADRTVNVSYITNDAPLTGTVGSWVYYAATFNTSASAGQVVNIYKGTLTQLATERTYSVTTDGSGAVVSDSSRNFMFGNRDEVGVYSSSFPGKMAWGMYFNRALTQNEIRSLQFNPRPISGCQIYFQMGYNDTGTQRNLCGPNNNSGTVTTATTSLQHVPLRSPFGN